MPNDPMLKAGTRVNVANTEDKPLLGTIVRVIMNEVPRTTETHKYLVSFTRAGYDKIIRSEIEIHPFEIVSVVPAPLTEAEAVEETLKRR